MEQLNVGDNINLTFKNEYKPTKSKKIFKLIKHFIILFFLTSITKVLILRVFPPTPTPLMYIRSIEKILYGKSPAFSFKLKPLNKISSSMQLAVVASEDQNFPNHYGIDFRELQKAYKRNLRKGKKGIRGASTITQQVAKNVFLLPNRSYFRKALEFYYTLLLETFWSKEKILEVYLNVIEMGDQVYGVEAASQKYYKKNASKILKSEACALAAILPNPRKYSIKNPSSFILKRRSWISRQMNSLGKNYLEKM